MSIPSYVTVVGGTPSNYSLSSGVEPWDEAVQYVHWVTSAQQGVTDTFTVNVIPQTESDGFDEFTAVAKDTANEVAQGSTAIWAKIGTSAPESQTVSNRPAQSDFTTDGTLLNINTIDDAGQWVPYAGGPVSLNNLPAMLPKDDPFEVGFKLLTAPVANQVASAQVRIENTTSQTEGLTWTIQLPAGWRLTSGSLSMAASLVPRRNEKTGFSRYTVAFES